MPPASGIEHGIETDLLDISADAGAQLLIHPHESVSVQPEPKKLRATIDALAQCRMAGAKLLQRALHQA